MDARRMRTMATHAQGQEAQKPLRERIAEMRAQNTAGTRAKTLRERIAAKISQSEARARTETERKDEKAEAGRQWLKEESSFSRLLKQLSMENHLFGKRQTLQTIRWKGLEKAWGRGNVAAVIFHTHTCGSKETGYDGSPDGVFSLDSAAPKHGGNPRLSTLLNKMGIDAVFLTDHDARDLIPLSNAIGRLNAKDTSVKFLGGTEMTSADGHFIIMESGRPMGDAQDFPPSKAPAIEMAKWAFDNGYDIMIPHPNPSYADPKRVAEHIFGVDIGIEKETVDEILWLADWHGRLVYIAYANGTTNANYRSHLLGTRDHWWQFWRPRHVNKETRELYERRAVWVCEADGHVQCEYPSNIVYFRRDRVAGPDGKVSSGKLHDAVEEQKEVELAALKEWRRPSDKESVMVPYSADEDFGTFDKMAEVPYYVSEYARLIYVWLNAIASGKAKQFSPDEKYVYRPRNESRVQSQYSKMAGDEKE